MRKTKHRALIKICLFSLLDSIIILQSHRILLNNDNDANNANDANKQCPR